MILFGLLSHVLVFVISFPPRVICLEPSSTSNSARSTSTTTPTSSINRTPNKLGSQIVVQGTIQNVTKQPKPNESEVDHADIELAEAEKEFEKAQKKLQEAKAKIKAKRQIEAKNDSVTEPMETSVPIEAKTSAEEAERKLKTAWSEAETSWKKEKQTWKHTMDGQIKTTETDVLGDLEHTIQEVKKNLANATDATLGELQRELDRAQKAVAEAEDAMKKAVKELEPVENALQDVTKALEKLSRRQGSAK